MSSREHAPTPTGRARLLLVEGVPGLGKSTVLDRLLRRHAATADDRRLRTVLHLTQAHTYGPLAAGEDAGTLTRAENLAHLEHVVGVIEWLAGTVASATVTKCFVLVDTLHLTHCLRPGVVGWDDVAPFDRRLAAAGCRLLLLDADDATIRARSVEARADTSFMRSYALRRLASDLAGLARRFTRERDAFRRMFAASSMPKLALAAEAPLPELADAAHAFWMDGNRGDPG